MNRLSAIMAIIASAAAVLQPLTGCSVKAGAENDLMSGITPNVTESTADINGEDADAAADFAVRLFQRSLNSESGENTLVSPYSVMSALSMTANGAGGETLSQMEEALGLPVGELNGYIKAYSASLPSDEKCSFHAANSIWFTDDDRFKVNTGFLQTNADYYGASIYEVPFDDKACESINNWVSDNTDGMIKKIIGEVSDYAVMYLINALAFDAEWEEIYEVHQVQDGVFTAYDNAEQDAEFMYSSERYYLADKNAKGFIKDYAGGKYAFAALLPDEGVSVSDYAASLTGERLRGILANAEQTKVSASVPKFRSEYSVDMNGILSSMGMTDAFDPYAADFSGIGTSSVGNIYIDRVIHKTFIEVGEKGTKAGAVTAVIMNDACAIVEEPPKEVYLDRPFVYMIIDRQANVPIFIGTVMSLK